MDKKKLSEILKKNGLDVAEDVAASAIKSIFKALPEIAKETPNKIDDSLVPLLAIIEPLVLSFVDQIDGEQG